MRGQEGEMGEEQRVRARVVFLGIVQGVGFRYTAVHIASSHDVVGHVRNQLDGSVELVAEGERAEVEAFVESVSRRMARYIRRRDVSWSAARGEYDDFGIRHGGD